jgi:hypothetical protein
MNPKMTITIESPLNGTDNVLPVFVNFTAQSSWHLSLGKETITTSDNQTQDWIKAFFYVLDGQNMRYSGGRFAETQMTGTSPTDSEHHFSGQTYLTNLADGIHSITVYYGVLVNVGSPNELIVYNANWSATSQFYVDTEATPAPSPTPTPAPSLTASPSPEPSQEPTLLQETQNSEPFPTILVAASVITVAVVSFALLVYFRKRKH